MTEINITHLRKCPAVGDGEMRSQVEAEIEKYDVKDHVILLGTKLNPYPYIKNCDIYAQPSFSEGWGLTIQEARILQKPIVVTNLPIMHEQICSGKNGLIVDSVTSDALCLGIKKLLAEPTLCDFFSKNLAAEECGNRSEVEKLYVLLEQNGD